MERAVIVGVYTGNVRRKEAEESLNELQDLVISAGADVVGSFLQHREKINPKYYIGEGKLREILEKKGELNFEVIVFDDRLSAAQYRNLEKRTGVKVIDRTQLILDIFAQRARSKEGKLQVELAQLMYLLPRLTGKGVELSRLGGGIGTRGPGEKKLEYERRRIRDRIAKIKRELKTISKRRGLHREKRRKSKIPMVSLAGYTSAGKTTLFNLLTSEDYFVSKKLFSTLDPLTRVVNLKNGLKFFISDTVGFIKKLPVELVKAFKSTLEEMVQSDLILHVIDYSSDRYNDNILSVKNTFEEIGVSDKSVINVYNKIDKIDDGFSLLKKNRAKDDREVFISAKKEWGIDNLLEKIEYVLFKDYKLFKVKFSARDEGVVKNLDIWGFVVKKSKIGEEIIIDVYIKYEDMVKFLPKLKGKGEIL